MMAPEQLAWALMWAFWATGIPFAALVYMDIAARREGRHAPYRKHVAAVMGVQAALAALIAAVAPASLAAAPGALDIRPALAAFAALWAALAVVTAREYRPSRTPKALEARRD